MSLNSGPEWYNDRYRYSVIKLFFQLFFSSDGNIWCVTSILFIVIWWVVYGLWFVFRCVYVCVCFCLVACERVTVGFFVVVRRGRKAN